MAWEEQRNAPSERAGLVAAVVLALLLLFPAQVVLVLAVDAAGLDGVLPPLLVTVLLPALAVSLIPAGAARRLYSRRAARLALAGTFLLAALAARALRDVYVLCSGSGC